MIFIKEKMSDDELIRLILCIIAALAVLVFIGLAGYHFYFKTPTIPKGVKIHFHSGAMTEPGNLDSTSGYGYYQRKKERKEGR